VTRSLAELRAIIDLTTRMVLYATSA